MRFLSRKKEVPEELPALALDNMKNNFQQNSQQLKKAEQKYPMLPTQNFQDQQQAPQIQSQQSPYLAQNQQTPIQTQQLHNFQPGQKTQEEQGYFRDLIKNVINSTGDIKQLDSWYKNKFLQEDVVFHMREYWEKQQPQLLLKNISGELKNKLMGKTEKLHALEKEWQEAYFNLLSKEEQIRKEEKELKDSLSEFMNLFKNAKRNKKE